MIKYYLGKNTKNYCCILIIVFLPLFLFGQTIQTSNTNNELISVFFINENTGWIVGKNSTIIKTDDGGENWQLVAHSYQYCFVNIQFVNEKIGWIAATNGIDWGSGTGSLLKTVDGGNTWNLIMTCENNYDIRSFSFINDTIGWLTDEGGSSENFKSRIYKTTDGGINWQIQKDDWEFSRSIQFINENTGWACGYSEMLHTNDGGEHWVFQTLQTERDHYTMHFSSEQDGWSAGNTMEKTDNSGNTWNIVNKPESSTPESSIRIIRSVFFLNKNSGAICGRGVYITNDNGGSWKNIGINGSYRDIYILDLKNAWSVGENGLIVKFPLDTTTTEEPVIQKINERSKEIMLFQNYPNPFNNFTTIHFTLQNAEHISLKIFNSKGQYIATLSKEELSAGEHQINWNAKGIPSGVYYCMLQTFENIEIKKIVIQK